MDKILVIGSKGQLGNSVRELESELSNFEMIYTDVDTLDITDEKATADFFDYHSPRFVINCSAYTAVDKAEEDTAAAELINAAAIGTLVRQCAIVRADFIHISTDYVFDGKANKPYTESSPVNPQSVYGQTKLSGERVALSFDRSVVIRTSWLYSSYGNNFVKTMLRLGGERSELSVVNDQIGCPTYAGDLAAAIVKIIKKLYSGADRTMYGVFHYSDAGECSWYDFATEIMRLGGKKCTVKPITTAEYPTAAVRPAYSVMSKSKIKSVYSVKVPMWKESLATCIKKLS